MSAEAFTNEFIDSIRDGKGDSFLKRYREMDLLLVEDIKFLTAKEPTQQNLFLTFNATIMHADRKICADGRAPLHLQPGRRSHEPHHERRPRTTASRAAHAEALPAARSSRPLSAPPTSPGLGREHLVP